MGLELKYPIWLLCEIAGVSTSAYYKYKNAPIKANTKIEDLILDIYHKSNKRAGYRTITFTLKNDYNLTVNHKKIQRIMKKHDIKSIVRKKFKVPKEVATIKENILNRNFHADKPGEKFVTDITYIPTQRKMLYLCTMIDLFNNEPVAWNISDTQDKYLSIDTLKMLSKKYDLKGSIIHSDQGVHYTSKAYVEIIKELQAVQSMSRRGNCWDNAKAESFFSHFKCETIHIMDRRVQDINDLNNIASEYMDYYINARPQKLLGGIPPSLYKQRSLCS